MEYDSTAMLVIVAESNIMRSEKMLKKRIVPILLAMMLVLNLSVFAFAADGDDSFTDLSEEQNLYIKPLVDLEVITGYPDSTFGPEHTLTRAHMAAILARFLGLEESETPADFTDVDTEMWYATVIQSCVEAGLFQGYDDGSFGPDDFLTKAQLAVLIERIADPAAQIGDDDALASRWDAVSAIREINYVVATVTSVDRFGNVVLDINGNILLSMAFNTGDIVTVEFGDTTLELPVVSEYGQAMIGDPLVRARNNATPALMALNMDNFGEEYGILADETVYITLKEAGGYAQDLAVFLEVFAISRTNDREDYPDISDAAFANFRDAAVGDIAPGMLFRSSSPINPNIGRASYADQAAEAAGIAVIINLAQSESEIEALINDEETFDSPYYAGLYEDGKVAALAMGVAFRRESFGAKLATGIEFMLANEGPYLIHCDEGKDRVGFTFALLQALMGATYEEILDDYMTTYENYWKVEQSDAYSHFADINAGEMLRYMAGLERGQSLDGADIAKAANDYLLGIGLEQSQIDALKDILSAGQSLADAA